MHEYANAVEVNRPSDLSRHAQTSARIAAPREPTAPLLGETIGRLGSVLSRLGDVYQRTRAAKEVMFGSTPSPAGVGGNVQSKDMPTSDVIRNQLGALEHLTMLLEEDTQVLLNQLGSHRMRPRALERREPHDHPMQFFRLERS
jgi:hypothetical protein